MSASDTASAARAVARSFLNGGGELGQRIREFDWASNPLGPPEQWPHGLKTAVRIMLTSRQPMWIGWGDELIYLYNDPYKSIIGGKHPWAIGRPTSEVWPEIWSDISSLLATAMQGDQGTYTEAQLLIMERNGYPEETYYTFSYSPIPDDHGGTGGIICANTDDTERVIRERQLTTLRQLAAAAAEARSVEDACVLIGEALSDSRADIPFALLYVRDADAPRLRLAARSNISADHPCAPEVLALDATVPWPVARTLEHGHPTVIAAPAAAALPHGSWDRPPSQAVIAPFRHRGQAGTAGLLILGLNPYRLYDDSYRSFVDLLAGHVETGLANAEAYEGERRRAEALAELDRAKTVFFSNVSHEFRTPLTLMLGPTERALQSPGQALRGQDLEVVHRNELRLLKLVNSLLDFSRIEAGRTRAHFVPTDLAAYTRELVSVFESAVDRAGLQLVVDCPPLPEPVYVDRDLWEKIVLNLVSNALKYTFDGRISAALRCVNGNVELTVQDTGTGIPADQLPRIFERFHRVEGARGRTHEGTGIGLALVQELVRLHGGAIDVESATDVGTAFRVSLPLGQAHLPHDQVSDTPRSSTAAPITANSFVQEAMRWLPNDLDVTPEPVAAPPRSLAGAARVLVADDNADMREYVTRLLGEHWQVEAVANGRLAIDMLARHDFDLVVADVMMPELDGFGLLAALRADPATRDLPVLMLSARAGEDATVGGLQAGASDYLVKPFSARELIARVEAQLLRARVRAVERSFAARLREVFAHVPVAIALTRGPEHIFELANPAYVSMFKRDVVGRPVTEAFPELSSIDARALLDHVYQTGVPTIERGWPMQTRPDEAAPPRFLDLTLQPLFAADGQIEGVAIAAYDVTGMVEARRHAEAASRTKDEFLAMLGHELRNPLAPILTALHLMRLRGIDAATKERDVIERQVNHLVRLVDDLLDVSRITGGKVQLQRAPRELADIVATAVETSSPLFEQHHHHMVVDVPASGLTVEVDAERLTQVVSNLLTNAAKYTNPGGTVTIRGTREGDEVVLAVADTGIGIEPDMLPRVFELFSQEAQAIDRAKGGLGLGLAIVRSLVTLHGGTVSVASAGRNRGSTFSVRLPYAPGATAPAPAERSAGSAAAPLNGRRVLVVDDNVDAADMLQALLAFAGYTVECAHDGPAALASALRQKPDVALVDIGLPLMDGYEVAREFARDARLSSTRLIAVTGYGQEQDRRRSAEAGFSAHLVKPLDIELLRSTIAALLEPARPH